MHAFFHTKQLISAPPSSILIGPECLVHRETTVAISSSVTASFSNRVSVFFLYLELAFRFPVSSMESHHYLKLATFSLITHYARPLPFLMTNRFWILLSAFASPWTALSQRSKIFFQVQKTVSANPQFHYPILPSLRLRGFSFSFLSASHFQSFNWD